MSGLHPEIVPLFETPEADEGEPVCAWPRLFRLEWSPQRHPGSPVVPVAYGMETAACAVLVWVTSGDVEVVRGNVRATVEARHDRRLCLVYQS